MAKDDSVHGASGIHDVTGTRDDSPQPDVGWASDGEVETYRRSYDRRTESASTAVISTVAAVTGMEPTRLDPLHGAVDPVALDRVFSGDRQGGRVEFSYLGYRVTVHSDGLIELNDRAS